MPSNCACRISLSMTLSFFLGPSDAIELLLFDDFFLVEDDWNLANVEKGIAY